MVRSFFVCSGHIGLPEWGGDYDTFVEFPIEILRWLLYISVELPTDILMSQHYLLSAQARSLSLATVLRMSDTDTEKVFAGIRWAATDGKRSVPALRLRQPATTARRATGALRFRCKACRRDFSASPPAPCSPSTSCRLQHLPRRPRDLLQRGQGQDRAWPSRVTWASNTRRRSSCPTSCVRRWRPRFKRTQARRRWPDRGGRRRLLWRLREARQSQGEPTRSTPPSQPRTASASAWSWHASGTVG